jgi:hypothetical protein
MILRHRAEVQGRKRVELPLGPGSDDMQIL